MLPFHKGKCPSKSAKKKWLPPPVWGSFLGHFPMWKGLARRPEKVTILLQLSRNVKTCRLSTTENAPERKPKKGANNSTFIGAHAEGHRTPSKSSISLYRAHASNPTPTCVC